MCFHRAFICVGVFQKNETEVCDVAVKVLKENSSNETQVDFLREVEIMSTFDHPNILALLGVVIIGKTTTLYENNSLKNLEKLMHDYDLLFYYLSVNLTFFVLFFLGGNKNRKWCHSVDGF